MAAGQGFKTFTTGEVLTAADVNGYLMQGVGVFTDAANRDAEITSPQEGQFAYLKDTNVTTYYTGSAWANLDTTGMTNPMTTTGDTIYSSSGSTPARLGIGSTGQVLTVAGGVPTWAAPSAGATGWALKNSGSTSITGVSTVTFSGLSSKKYLILFQNISTATSSSELRVRFNGDTDNDYSNFGGEIKNNDPWAASNIDTMSGYSNSSYVSCGVNTVNGYIGGALFVDLADTTGWKNFIATVGSYDNITSGAKAVNSQGFYEASAAITSITIFSSSGTNFDGSSVAYILGAD